MSPDTKRLEEPTEPEPVASGALARIRLFLGSALLVIAVPLLLLAASAITGIGLDQNLPNRAALIGAICLVILPAFFIATYFGSGALAHGLAFCVWSILILTAFPSYFPERREPVTRIGLEYLTMTFGESPFGQSVRRIAIDSGMGLLRFWGPEPARSIRAERRNADVGANRSDARIAFDHDSSADAMANAADRDSDRRSRWIPYRGDGQSIIISAHVDGPNFGEELQFVFDTGATLSTVNKATLDLLDIPLDDNAPRITLRTAAGEVEAQLALVDAVWLEGELVEWVTVAVCEPCANETVSGLLGLNVSSHFRTSIDHEKEEIELVPRPGRRNRRLDVQPWLEINSVLRHFSDGRLEVTVNVKNLARQGIRSSVFEVSCSDENFTIRLDPIPAFGSLSQPVFLPWGSRCEDFEIHPLAATWMTVRS